MSCSNNYRPIQSFFNSTIDVGSLDPWQWPLDGIIIPQEPLTEAEEATIPWIGVRIINNS